MRALVGSAGGPAAEAGAAMFDARGLAVGASSC